MVNRKQKKREGEKERAKKWQNNGKINVGRTRIQIPLVRLKYNLISYFEVSML